MVRIVIDYDVVRASPAPVGRVFPIAWEDFKSESTVKPKAMESEVKPGEPKWVVRAKIGESAVLVRMIHVESRVILIVVSIPMIIGNVRPFVYSPILIPMHIARAALRPCWRWRRNMSAVPAMLSTAALRNRAHSQQ